MWKIAVRLHISGLMANESDKSISIVYCQNKVKRVADENYASLDKMYSISTQTA